MDTQDNFLQQQLERLEAGEPLEACLAELPPEEAALLRKAARLLSLRVTESTPRQVQSQRQVLLSQAREPAPRSTGRPWGWLAAGAAAAAVLLCTLALATAAGGAWLLRTTVAGGGLPELPFARATPKPRGSAGVAAVASDQAVLAGVRGLVEVLAADGSWNPGADGQVLARGQRVRTQALSGAELHFGDGSHAALGPDSELSIDELDAPASGRRTIVLTQWAGESEHVVARSSDPEARYEANTPAGSGRAQGTRFRVRVTQALLVFFDVEEGAVAVTGLNVTVVVVAGQSTLIIAGEPPAEPSFRIQGEGEVQRSGRTWQIAGHDLLVTSATTIVGDPQVGDWVAFEGRVLVDGTRLAHRIVLLRRAQRNTFEFAGLVETIGPAEWTIAGRAVQVDGSTQIDPGLAIGDTAQVRGVLSADGRLRATRIERLVTNAFEFTGVVQSIAPEAWAISGLTVTVDVSTTVEPGIVPGDVVRVAGRIAASGAWIAETIQRVGRGGGAFEITGVVSSRDPWIVAGVTLTTTASTEIDDDIEVGDHVRAEGRILPDGTWLALEIERLEDDDEPLDFELVGRVASVDPWVVAGVPLSVDDETRIRGDVRVGSLVKVKGRVLADGTLLARKIQALSSRRGCVTFTTVIREVSDDAIIVLDWRRIRRHGVRLEGELRFAAVIIVHGCVAEDGSFQILQIVVIYQLEGLPVIIREPRDDNDHDDDDDDDDDDEDEDEDDD